MQFLGSLTLKVEATPGCMIDDAARDLCEAADRFGMVVESCFNGETIFVRPGQNWRDVVSVYHKSIDLRHSRPAENLTEAIWRLTQLSDEQRLSVFERFCVHCGCIQPESGRRCQCWNDE